MRQLGRDVADVALMARSLYDWCPEDPLSQPHFNAQLLDPEPMDPKTLRIAWSADLGLGFAVDTDVMKVMVGEVDYLRQLGWTIETVNPTWPERIDGYALPVLQQAALAAQFGKDLGTK
ncbi:amidase family protein [Pseudomonas asuensis]|uniref:Amidase domain-containing protein n=1 Tax=Pseudomonas asuensis TaxID=1825787 RepID=A0ABQ2H252_9PSED|nr:amidase family protein [Pseudomonas asuensis]GGM23571.1 hypothetical protein GCM10009425_38060 [Pseudomonas asuensis]